MAALEPIPCANCGRAVETGSGWCTACGTALGTRLCANGHVMDAGWDECRYCAAKPVPGATSDRGPAEEVGLAVGTQVGEAGGFGSLAGLLAGSARRSAAGPPDDSALGSWAGARDEPPDPERSPTPKHRTVYDPGLPRQAVPAARGASPAAAPSPRSPAGASRLVGWLVTFGLDPCGVDYRLREGRNVIGADPECEVVIAEERGISGQHAVIMVRHDQVQIRDNDSMNGTYVNGRDVFGQTAVLEDGDRIRLGQVELTVYLL